MSAKQSHHICASERPTSSKPSTFALTRIGKGNIRIGLFGPRPACDSASAVCLPFRDGT
jgi:hypothetical protein